MIIFCILTFEKLVKGSFDVLRRTGYVSWKGDPNVFIIYSLSFHLRNMTHSNEYHVLTDCTTGAPNMTHSLVDHSSVVESQEKGIYCLREADLVILVPVFPSYILLPLSLRITALKFDVVR